MIKTTPKQREQIYQDHQVGQTYAEIAQRQGVSQACVRYWCRRQRDGHGVVRLSPKRQRLERFDPQVAFVILRLRLRHPKWGPERIRFHLQRRPSLQECKLPSRAQIGRYLHQWPRFRRQPKDRPNRAKLPPALYPHQRWQIDFKIKIRLGGQSVQLFSAYDEASGACLGARLFPNPSASPQLGDVVCFLRECFTRWGVLPAQLQTDGEPVLVGRTSQQAFPARFRLWLVGLGITSQVIPSGQPTENAEVERGHRTLNEYVLTGSESQTWETVNERLRQAVVELAHELPSRGKNCQGHPPVVVYPSLLDPQRPYHPVQEGQLFSLARVDAFLAQQTWLRRTDQNGQVSIGERRRYAIGRQHANKQVRVGFDPEDRNFVFFEAQENHPEEVTEIARRPARSLEVKDLLSPPGAPLVPAPRQLPLQFVWPERVYVNEQIQA